MKMKIRNLNVPITGKIVIEIDPGVLENAVFAVLKSERGQEAIRSIPKKNTKTKGRT